MQVLQPPGTPRSRISVRRAISMKTSRSILTKKAIVLKTSPSIFLKNMPRAMPICQTSEWATSYSSIPTLQAPSPMPLPPWCFVAPSPTYKQTLCVCACAMHKQVAPCLPILVSMYGLWNTTLWTRLTTHNIGVCMPFFLPQKSAATFCSVSALPRSTPTSPTLRATMAAKSSTTLFCMLAKPATSTS